MRFSCHYKSRGKLGIKGLHIGTYSFGPECSRVISRKFNGISARYATDFVACVDLLRYKWLRRGNENNLTIREPSIDFGRRSMQ